MSKLKNYLPVVLPIGWDQIQSPVPDTVAYMNDQKGLKIILGLEPHDDGCEWLHLSISGKGVISGMDRIPTYSELAEAKEVFLGTHSKAVMVLPPRKEWVNIHPCVLHLFSNVDEDSLPDFTRGSGAL